MNKVTHIHVRKLVQIIYKYLPKTTKCLFILGQKNDSYPQHCGGFL